MAFLIYYKIIQIIHLSEFYNNKNIFVILFVIFIYI
uniref:Uncharacterized protein n=1 Tax=viral metagenome TaxID=1070528 RepID=A0A6C0IEV7_9ZZZZ